MKTGVHLLLEPQHSLWESREKARVYLRQKQSSNAPERRCGAGVVCPPPTALGGRRGLKPLTQDGFPGGCLLWPVASFYF